MPLFQRRARQTEKAAAAARGESKQLTTRLDESTRVGIIHAMMDTTSVVAANYELMGVTWDNIEQALGHLLTREWHRTNLGGSVRDYLISRATDQEVLDATEAWIVAAARVVERVLGNSGVYYSPTDASAVVSALADRFRDQVNDVFDDADTAFQVVGPEVVPRDSMAMHATVVAPVMALTHGQPRFAKVERAYQKALHEMKPGGDPSDAITDAATALQEMLSAAGARGESLGPLLTDARKRGLLGPFDSKLSDGIALIGDWVSAQRSASGDAHHVRDASRADAWLAIHVAGALMLRLGA